jgi:hypothetical protein
MAGDSRQTQVISNVNRVGSDSASKVFQLTDTILAATAGWAFLLPPGAILQRNISSLVDEFKSTIPSGTSVQGAAQLLRTFFDGVYQNHVSQLPTSAVPAGQTALSFVVAGYEPNSRVGEQYWFDIPSTSAALVAGRTSNEPGPWWIGQTDVVARIANGYDFRALALPSIQAANQTGSVTTELNGLNYAIYWNTMTLQDAIDFAVSCIQITTTIQKFTAGTVARQGAVAGVGGPIDVAVVKPGGTAEWIERKKLHT